MTLNEVHQTGRERVRDRERPGPSDNQATLQAACVNYFTGSDLKEKKKT